jgi:hypothetical protein
MKNAFKRKKYFIWVCLSFIAVTAIAWQVDNKKEADSKTCKHYATGDTTQPKQRSNDQDEFRMNELQDAIKKLDIGMQKLDLNMKDLNIELSQHLDEAINKIDFEKISRQIDEQMKKIDVDKIKIDVNNSVEEAQDQLKKIDLEKMEKDIDEQMKKIDADKIKIDLNKSIQQVHDQLKQIDMQKLRNEMLDLQQNFNSSKFKMQVQDAIKGAKESMERAKEELRDMQEFTDQLEKDGLIDKKKGYSVEWKKEGDLYINGKKQPKEISDKYSRYYKKDGYKIERSGDNGRHKESL